jgi:hypothetical protein
MDGPFGVKDCLWRLEGEGKPIPTNLVQLTALS